MTPPVVCIIGKKNSGKTRHAIALAAELLRRGRRVMTVKHGHGFEIDKPGTDSWKHRHEGGARRVVLAGPTEMAVFGEWPTEEMGLDEIVERFLWDAELVLAEGYMRDSFPKIEIFRRDADPEPIYGHATDHPGSYLAIATDAVNLDAPCPVLRLDDPRLIAKLADLIESELLS